MAISKTTLISMTKAIIVSILIGILIGFFIGKSFFQTSAKIKYVKGETIEKTIQIPIPYRVEIPATPQYIYKIDTISETIYQTVDTTAILADWVLKREYKEKILNNTQGELDIEAEIQYNRLQSMKYTFTPTEVNIEKQHKPRWTPYISTSVNTFNQAGIGGGLFYQNIGAGARMITDFEKKGFEIELNYKF